MRFLYILFVVFIMSCSYQKSDDTCRINGNEYYLKTNSLCLIVVPDDLIFPECEKDYNIPDIKNNDLNIGKDLNICPPILVY